MRSGGGFALRKSRVLLAEKEAESSAASQRGVGWQVAWGTRFEADPFRRSEAGYRENHTEGDAVCWLHRTLTRGDCYPR